MHETRFSLPARSNAAVIVFLMVGFIFSACSKKGDKNPAGPSSNDTITDVDGNKYRTVKIGNQWWTSENVKVTHYRNGDAIPRVTGATEWISLITGAYCNYDNDATNVSTYGRLYNWYAVNDSRMISPIGWHVPTDEEWKTLEMYLGMSREDADNLIWRGTDEGGKLKESGFEHWQSPNTGATNESGFTALPGGARLYHGIFYLMGSTASFWTSTEGDENKAWSRSLGCCSNPPDVGRSQDYKYGGFSIRLLRD
jgi:uncharacterized protein (TIGR02145 family)